MEERRVKPESRSITKSINFKKESTIQNTKDNKNEEALGFGKEEVASSSESHFWTFEKQMHGN